MNVRIAVSVAVDVAKIIGAVSRLLVVLVFALHYL